MTVEQIWPETGDLRSRITFQQRSATGDGFGQQLTNWSDAFTCWGKVDELSGNKLLRAQAIRADVTDAIYIRYRTGVTPDMRAQWNGTVYTLHAVLDMSSRHVMYEILCTRGLAQG